MHHRPLFSLASLLTSASLAAAAVSIDIFPLASSFRDYIAPDSIEIAGLTLERHRLGLDARSENMQEWNDYTFVINEYDRNEDILRQSLCEEAEVASMTDEGEETICYYSPGLEEMLGTLSSDDIEDIQMEYAGVVEDYPTTASFSGDGKGAGLKNEDKDDGLAVSLRQTLSLRFGPAIGEFSFLVSVVGEDGMPLGSISTASDDWSCDVPDPDDPSQAQSCIWNPSNRNDRRIDLQASLPSRQ